ncbi:flap endonuclease 1-B isoform X1 [Panicum miliaceum]|uniref:Flap endonuclease 1-B isoform X1 n=1 Tax=Panicum miliaceum TaxID=4540 RepID=A0A3L6SAI5_PANMI|nr:flap endonuclease 1-B isoform X1 [Panicum miliaceum]
MGIKGLTKLLAEHAPGAAVQRRVENYRGRVIAVDASLSIYQFLIVVGRKGSELLTNESGEVTRQEISLAPPMGMLNRTVRMLEAGIKPVFVFDGEPPEMKKKELAKRSLKRDDATKDLNRAIEIGDEDSVEKFSKKTVKVTKKHNDDCKRLLRLMGVPVVETNYRLMCSFSATEGNEYLSFADHFCRHQVRLKHSVQLFVKITRFLHHLTDLGYKKSLVTEFEVSKVLEELGLTMDQFIDLCILSGCDYCENIKGVLSHSMFSYSIGGQRARKLIRQHGCIEEVGQNLKQTRFSVPEDWPYQEVRTLFKQPNVCTGIPDFMWTSPDSQEPTCILGSPGQGLKIRSAPQVCKSSSSGFRYASSKPFMLGMQSGFHGRPYAFSSFYSL